MIFKKDFESGSQMKLIELCRQNDRRAQLNLYNEYAKAMYNVCLNIIHNKTEAEEMMQEGFISAFQHLDTFKGEVAFGAWLKRIMVNKSIDFLKKRKIQFDKLDEFKNLPESTDEADIDLSQAKLETIRTEIAKLPEGFRTILSLYLFEGYDHDEIAYILGIKPSTSRSQYARARSLLLKRLKTVQ